MPVRAGRATCKLSQPLEPSFPCRHSCSIMFPELALHIDWFDSLSWVRLGTRACCAACAATAGDNHLLMYIYVCSAHLRGAIALLHSFKLPAAFCAAVRIGGGVGWHSSSRSSSMTPKLHRGFALSVAAAATLLVGQSCAAQAALAIPAAASAAGGTQQGIR